MWPQYLYLQTYRISAHIKFAAHQSRYQSASIGSCSKPCHLPVTSEIRRSRGRVLWLRIISTLPVTTMTMSHMYISLYFFLDTGSGEFISLRDSSHRGALVPTRWFRGSFQPTNILSEWLRRLHMWVTRCAEVFRDIKKSLAGTVIFDYR